MKSNPQTLVAYYHPTKKLFYVGCYNSSDPKKFKYSSAVNHNYDRARFIYNSLIKSDGNYSGLQSGFMMALINTDLSGWVIHQISEQFASVEQATEFKLDWVSQLESDLQAVYVGSDRIYTKGIHGAGKTPANWNRKWNIGAMKQHAVRAKIDFICKSIDSSVVPNSIYTDAYMAIVAPDTHGPRMKNFGAYHVECLATLFRFVRQYIGLDQEAIISA